MRVGTRNYAAITAPEGCEKGRGVCYAMLREGDALPQPQSGSVQYRRCTGARQLFAAGMCATLSCVSLYMMSSLSDIEGSKPPTKLIFGVSTAVSGVSALALGFVGVRNLIVEARALSESWRERPV